MSELPRLMATFRPQAYIRGDAVDIDGAVEFDATDEALDLDWDVIRDFEYHAYDSDHLADSLPERNAHGGPFEVDVDLDAWLELLGVPDRSELTEDAWKAIQAKYSRLSPELRMINCCDEDSDPNEYLLEGYDDRTSIIRTVAVVGTLQIYNGNNELLAVFACMPDGLRLDVYGDLGSAEPTSTTIFEPAEAE